MKRPNWLIECQSFLNYDLRFPHWLVYPIRTVTDWWYYRPFKVGRIFQACNLHPCKITSINVDDNDIEGESILNGSLASCSLSSCGVYLMEEEEIQQYVDAWNRDGERGLLTVYSGSEESADQFIKEWR